MGYLNKVLLIGRLGQDPEKRITPSGHSVVSVSIATTDYFKDKSGNKQERTEWHKVVFWNRQAEIVEQYCRKGSQLFVEGSLQTSDWQDKDGNKRYKTEIVARAIQLLDSKQGSGYQNNQQATPQPRDQYNAPPQSFQGNNEFQGAPPIGNDDFIEDDIPF
ncbi:single-stranded DNA-binding protein [bacterium]|nr:single-stranded DNA-binding protein [bacterium]